MSNFLRNALSLAGIAVLTMSATVAVFHTSSVGAAEGDGETVKSLVAQIKPTVAKPTLEAEGCAFTLKMDKSAYVAADKPVLTVSATNNGAEAVTRSVTVTVYGRSLISEGRMPARAMPLFTKVCEFTLAAGETKSMEVATDLALPADQAISMAMSTGEKELEKPVVRRAKAKSVN